MAKHIIFAILAVSISISVGRKFPSDVQRCKAGDVTCICKVANDLVRKYPKGRADLGVPSIDPYVLNRTVDLSPSSLQLNLKVKNLELRGLSTQTFQKAVGFSKDPFTSKFELYGKIDKLSFTGNYAANGSISFIPIQGNGLFHLNLDGIDGAVKFKPVVEKRKDGKHYMRIDKIKVLLQPEKIKVQLDNLFNGNKEVGDSVNQLLNDDVKLVWDEIYPRAIGAAEVIMKDIIDKIFSQFAYEDIYLN